MHEPLGLKVRQRLFDLWQSRDGLGQCKNVTRVRAFQRDPAEQALHIEHSVEAAPQLFARDHVLNCSA